MFISQSYYQLTRRRCRSWRLRPRISAYDLQAKTGLPLRLAKALCLFTLLPTRCTNNAWHNAWTKWHGAGLPTGHVWLVRRRRKEI